MHRLDRHLGRRTQAIEIGDVHADSGRDERHPAGRYAVRPFLLFLYLLECEAELFGEGDLAHVQLTPS